jgi:hypothetical protein
MTTALADAVLVVAAPVAATLNVSSPPESFIYWTNNNSCQNGTGGRVR